MDTEIYSKRLSVSDKELLLRYLAKAYPFRTDLNAFIDFTLSYVPKEGMEKSLLIFKGKEIIGANMFLQTKAKIGKTEYDIVWKYQILFQAIPMFPVHSGNSFHQLFWVHMQMHLTG